MNYAEALLARRYALALLRVCGDQFSHDDLLAMQRAVEFFKSHAPALYFLRLPDLPVHAKNEIVQKLFETVKLPHCFHQLAALLSQHKRPGLIAPILTLVLELYKEQHGIMDVRIESSSALDAAQLKIIQAFLAQMSAKTINYTHRVDPDLIAGIRLQSSSVLWEYSVRKKLRAIRLSVIR